MKIEDLFQRSSDLQLRDEKVTLNHLVYIHIFYRIPWEFILPTWMVDFNGNISEYVIPMDPMGYEKHIEFETSGYFFFEMFLPTNFRVFILVVFSSFLELSILV